MRLFSRRVPEVARPHPTIEEIFREDLGFIVGSLGRFGIAAIDVDDAAHEVIRAAERTLPRFDPSRDLRSWLYGVAFHVASNRLRRARRHRARFVDEAADVAEAIPTIEEHLIESEIHRTVREVVDAIDLDRRAVLIARVVHGMSGDTAEPREARADERARRDRERGDRCGGSARLGRRDQVRHRRAGAPRQRDGAPAARPARARLSAEPARHDTRAALGPGPSARRPARRGAGPARSAPQDEPGGSEGAEPRRAGGEGLTPTLKAGDFPGRD
jgi:RNA polymerase sigma-70 factor (ECF subfamily)